MSKEEIYDRMIGCLYGQAIGDALGLCSEFMSKKEVTERFFSNVALLQSVLSVGLRSLAG